MPRKPGETEQQYRDRKRREGGYTTRSNYPGVSSGTYVRQDYDSTPSYGSNDDCRSSSSSDSGSSSCGE